MITERSLIGMRRGLRWAGPLAVLVALGCAGSKGPTGAEQEGPFGAEIEEEGIAGRSPETLANAARLGLETVYFAFDSFALRGEAKSALRHNFDVLRDQSELLIEIQGNCDERGSEEYNLALGDRRARAARQYLVRLGIAADRLGTVSFGESNPVVRGHSEAAWTRNRRADFAVLP